MATTVNPTKRRSAFSPTNVASSLTPEDLANITDPTAKVTVANQGVTSSDLTDLNSNTDAQISNIINTGAASKEFAVGQDAMSKAKLQTQFAFNMEDLALAQQAGVDAINSGAAKRGILDSGVRLNDQEKFKQEVQRKEGRLQIGLDMTMEEMALGLAEMLRGIDSQTLQTALGVDSGAFDFINNLINSAGGGTVSGGSQNFGSAYNYSKTAEAQQYSQQIGQWAENISAQFGGLRVASHQRDPQHNEEIGGSANSDHLWGGAIDFSSSGGKDDAKLDELYAYLQNYVGNGVRLVIWRQAGHYDHLHVSFDGGDKFKLPPGFSDPQNPVSPSNNDTIKAPVANVTAPVGAE